MSQSIASTICLAIFGMASTLADPLLVARAHPAQSPTAVVECPRPTTVVIPTNELAMPVSWLSSRLQQISSLDFLAGFGSTLSEPWLLTRENALLVTAPDLSFHNWDVTAPTVPPTEWDAPTTSFLCPMFEADEEEGHFLDFTYANWVRQRDVSGFQRYVGRRYDASDPYSDPGKARTKDYEFAYRLYFLGNFSDYLDESDTWHADAFGRFVEHVDGITNVIKALEDSLFKNNLFRPSNPFKKWDESLSGTNTRSHGVSRNDAESDPIKAWQWKGDLSIGGGGGPSGMNINEVTFHLGQFRFSKQFKIKVDFFYLEED